MTKSAIKSAAEVTLFFMLAGAGFIAKHWKVFLVGLSGTILILILGVILHLMDELTFTKGCLEAVQKSLTETDLELDVKTRKLNDLENYLAQQHGKEVPRD